MRLPLKGQPSVGKAYVSERKEVDSNNPNQGSSTNSGFKPNSKTNKKVKFSPKKEEIPGKPKREPGEIVNDRPPKRAKAFCSKCKAAGKSEAAYTSHSTEQHRDDYVPVALLGKSKANEKK